MIKLFVLETCPRCRGSGQMPVLYTMVPCDTCKGQKVSPQYVRSSPGVRLTFDKDLILQSGDSFVIEYEVDS